MELRDRILRIGFTGHRHEGEAAGFAGEFVLHEHYFAHCPGLGEEVLEIWLGGVEREVPDVEFGAHGLVCWSLFSAQRGRR